MTTSEYRDLLSQLQILSKEVKLWDWKTSEERVGLMSRLDAYYGRIKDIPLCLNLTAEKFKSGFLGVRKDRIGLVTDLAHALTVCAFESIGKEGHDL